MAFTLTPTFATTTPGVAVTLTLNWPSGNSGFAVNDAGGGGSFSNTSPGGIPPQSFTYTNNAGGVYTITAHCGAGTQIGQPDQLAVITVSDPTPIPTIPQFQPTRTLVPIRQHTWGVQNLVPILNVAIPFISTLNTYQKPLGSTRINSGYTNIEPILPVVVHAIAPLIPQLNPHQPSRLLPFRLTDYIVDPVPPILVSATNTPPFVSAFQPDRLLKRVPYSPDHVEPVLPPVRPAAPPLAFTSEWQPSRRRPTPAIWNPIYPDSFHGLDTIPLPVYQPMVANFTGLGTLVAPLDTPTLKNILAPITGLGTLSVAPAFTAIMTTSFSGHGTLTAIESSPNSLVSNFTGSGTLNAVLTTTVISSSLDYSVTGPATLQVGVASTFSIVRLRAGAASSVTVVASPSGTLTTSPMVLPSFGSGPVTFTFTPTTLGNVTFTFTNSGSLTDPAPITDPVGPSPLTFPTPCAPASTPGSTTDYTFSANNLPLTINPGETVKVTFSVPDMPGAEYIQSYRFTSAFTAVNDGNINHPYVLSGKSFPEPDISTPTPFIVFGGSPYVNASGTYTFPILSLLDDEGAVWLTNYNTSPVSGSTFAAQAPITITAMTFTLTMYNCFERRWSATSFNDTVVTFAWVSTKGTNESIKTAHHRSMKANIGNPTTGWEATDNEIELKACSGVGVSMLKTGHCLLNYTHNQYHFTRVSPSMGNGGSWGDRLPTLQTYFSGVPSGVDPITSAIIYDHSYYYGFQPNAMLSSGDNDSMIYCFNGNGLMQSPHLNGDNWNQGTIFSSRTGPGAWIGNGYCELEQNSTTGFFDSLGHPLYSKITSYINTDGIGHVWAGHDQSWPTNYVPSGMVRLHNGTLVTILHDVPPGTGKSYGAWSRDKGVTWTIAGTASEIIPPLEIGPALTVLGNTAVACWVDDNDNPNFALSEDSGANWD